MGGLGNQMFQYATAKHLSIINNTELKTDTSNFRRLTLNSEHTMQLTDFNISAQQATAKEIWETVQPTNSLARLIGKAFTRLPHKAKTTAVYKEPEGSGFKQDVLKIKGDRYLVGYFNSYKYFDAVRDVLLGEFTPKKAISSQGKETLKLIEATESVSLHIRRGDYVESPSVYKCIEGIITDNYYQNAIDLMASKADQPHFFVFSNDMVWVKENFIIPFRTTYVDFNTAQRGFEDLWLMSRCKHNITAGGSTFSWWAAYLNTNKEKIVIRTKQVSNDVNYNYPEDYFPKEWVAVES